MTRLRCILTNQRGSLSLILYLIIAVVVLAAVFALCYFGWHMITTL